MFECRDNQESSKLCLAANSLRNDVLSSDSLLDEALSVFDCLYVIYWLRSLLPRNQVWYARNKGSISFHLLNIGKDSYRITELI